MSVDVVGASVRDWMITSHPAITPRTSVATALRLLREHALPALPVSEGGRFLGLVDEPSLLRLTPSEATTLDVYEIRSLRRSLLSIVSSRQRRPRSCLVPRFEKPRF